MTRKAAPLHDNGMVNEAHLEQARRSGQAQMMRTIFAALRAALMARKTPHGQAAVRREG